MHKCVMMIGMATTVLLAGCEKAEAPAPTETMAVPVETAPTGAASDPAMAPHRFASWAGKWVGVEGMFVTITPTEPGRYSLEMQSDLDTRGTYKGRDSEHGIQFERGTEKLSLHRGSGEETGLKYLVDKDECLIVKTGEGYCRD